MVIVIVFNHTTNSTNHISQSADRGLLDRVYAIALPFYIQAHHAGASPSSFDHTRHRQPRTPQTCNYTIALPTGQLRPTRCHARE